MLEWAVMSPAPFDLGALFNAIDTEREHRGSAWRTLSEEVGVSVSTIRRFATADDAEADGVLALVRWLNAAPEDFVDGGSVPGELLPGVDRGFVRVDMALVAHASGDAAGARGRSRTTIQRLVAAAQGSGQPVAALVRVADS